MSWLGFIAKPSGDIGNSADGRVVEAPSKPRVPSVVKPRTTWDGRKSEIRCFLDGAVVGSDQRDCPPLAIAGIGAWGYD